MDWPGMTRRGNEPCADLKPLQTSLVQTQPLVSRPVIVLATATITDGNIFANGLFQNIFLLYRMFEAMGWAPILIVNQKPQDLSGIPELLRRCRVISVEDIIKQPLPVKVYMEIGMSIDPNLRRFLKMIGARICKLYLGNILNIDIETPMFYPGMNFSHHVIGELDRIWVSPHYGQHAEYACSLNHVDPALPYEKCAPYIWDPCILTDDGRRYLTWRPPTPGEKETWVIMEPNISFQKAALIPIMIAETWYRANKSWNGQVMICNGERLLQIPFFRDSILPTLDLHKDGKIVFEGRHDIVSILTKHPSATFLLHQWNNEYNYMTLELLWAGFPVIHNASAWSSFGYYYPGSDLGNARALLDEIRERHSERLETYKAHARCLAWKHSPYNPEIQKGWLKTLAE
jgi:hypothetical protein